MNCKECLLLIPGYLDDELSELQAGPMRQHLMDCRSCRKALSSEKSLKRWFAFEDALEVEVPSGFAQRVARRAFAGDTGEVPVGGGRLVALSGGDVVAAEGEMQRFVLQVTAAAAVLLLVLSAWMRNARLPDGGRMSAAEQGATVQELLHEADQLNAAEADSNTPELELEDAREDDEQ